MTFTLDEDFEWFIEKFGTPQKNSSVDEATFDKYRGHLPNRLLDYWKEFGFCQFKSGLFWLVNPDDYQEIMLTWLAGTGILELDNFHVFARTAFGKFYLFGEKSGQSWNIEILNGRIFHKGTNTVIVTNDDANEEIKSFFSVTGMDSVDVKDVDTRKFIFDSAVKKFGAPQEDEIFTFEPAPFLGGERTLKAINKVNLFIQSDILASMGQREIMDVKGLTKKAFGG